ncbi:SYCE2 protein, partial [Locustella ochotensis]|nr:SYCE2 protein [Locustella ochotensis]
VRAAAPLGQVSEMAEQLEERLFHAYGYHNELIQERLQELTEVMESVEEVQAELRHICSTVEAAYRDLCL